MNRSAPGVVRVVWTSLGALLGALLIVHVLTGCGSPPKVRTPFLRSVDLVEMTDRMSQSLAADPQLVTRGPDDEPWIVSLAPVTNHTNQIIPERERWLYVARLRSRLARTNLARERSFIWVIPPERWSMVSEELGLGEEPHGLRLPPTHLLTSEFHAITTTSGRGRSDAYICSYQLIDLADGGIVWEDQWEVKRAVSGLTYD